ncbi:MAG TPA: nucleoside-triphosphatase [Phycisphaerae bacterium]|nr:nucleoside-triphosphatase [Phycisphaerae bacterium]HNU44948.1 nucleoside-triphosphatase [Phycisphaerae bacterium]
MTIITGDRGTGKTTFLCAYLDAFKRRGITVGGTASPAVLQNDERVGYDCLDLRRGTRVPLARVGPTPLAATVTVGRYWFDADALAAGTAAILAAVRDGVPAVAIDEIGPLELAGQGWAAALEFSLHNSTEEQEIILVIRSSALPAVVQRFPSPLWSRARRWSPPWPALETLA